MLPVLLAFLKIGLYTPIGGHVPLLPYAGLDLINPDGHRPGLEAGLAMEPGKRRSGFMVNGQYHDRLVMMGAGLLGLSWRPNNDVTLGLGVSYRIPDEHLGPYASVAFRLGAIR